MKIIQQRVFINESQDRVNAFLSQFPAEDIVSTHFAIHGFENGCDEWTTIFYRVEEAT